MLSATRETPTGQAFCAILSHLTPDEVVDYSGNGARPSALLVGGSTETRGLDFDLETKPMLGGVGKNLSNTHNSVGWKAGQPTELLHGFLGESDHISYGKDIGPGQRRTGSGLNDLSFGRSIVADIGNSTIQSRGQSAVIEAVAAAASGKGGWGMRGPQSGNPLGCDDAVGDEFDPSLLLHSNASENHGAVARQGVPAGLSMFTSQSDQIEADGRNISSEPLMAGNNSLTGGVKELGDLDSLRRIVSKKSGEDSTDAVPHTNGRVSSHSADMRANIQIGSTEHNGANAVSKGGAIGENSATGKESSRSSAGQRRGTQRRASGGGEGREKRQKTNAITTDQR